ncbi:hypothetical protein [Trinickia mobilis]|uniref:hypothetical protein n=1 Tax=Trinickia mobilis TaxID=2816356 RepID=UPI001A8E1BD9|nr:hypothetical protein [Trinickia mobilis]
MPAEFQSKTPARLRDLAHKGALKLRPVVQQVMLDAAAEIEGSEEAYRALVNENRSLREKLAQTQTNLRGAYDIIARN